MMPYTLTLIRHGESESNVASRQFRKGKPIASEEALMRVHTSERRLTDRGQEQACDAGEWIRNWMCDKKIALHQCRFYASPYARAMETAALLDIPDAQWRLDARLCERDWGTFDQMTHEERQRRFGEELQKRAAQALFWRPKNGESFLDMACGRIRSLADTFHRECSRMHVVCVTHGETMRVFRSFLEYWTPWDLRDSMFSQDKREKIYNCRIIQYSREQKEAEPAERLVRLRMIYPENPRDLERNTAWQSIQRKTYGNADLLSIVSSYPRFLSA